MANSVCEIQKDESLETDSFNLTQIDVANIAEVKDGTLDLREAHIRYRILFFSCFITFGTYFCYDTPGALQEQIIHDLEITNTAEFSLLYSLYSWPNIILCFISGYLLDQVFGLRLGTIIFSSIAISGQLIFAIGCFVKQFWLMQVGRFIFGVGGETLCVCDSSFAVKWFKGKKLAMALGLQQSAAKIGATINFMSMVPIYNMVLSPSQHQRHISLGYCMLIAGLSCVLTQICVIVLWFLEGIAARNLKKTPLSQKNGKRIRILDIRFFPVNYWLSVAACLSYSISLTPFIGLCSMFIQKKYDFSAADASMALGLIYLVSIVGNPIAGLIVDHFHCNALGILIGLLFHLSANLIIAFTFWSPWIAMVAMGIGFSIVSPAVWCLIALQVSEKLVGTAYGITISVINIGMSVFSYLCGQVADHFGYFILELGFHSFTCLSICFVIILGVLESKEQRRITSRKQRQ